MPLCLLDRQPTLGATQSSLLEILRRSGAPRIHVHDYSAVDVPSLREAKRHSCSLRAERALVMAQRGDVVLLNRPPDAHFLDYLEELNLGTRRELVLALDDVFEKRASAASEPLIALAIDPEFADRVAELVAALLRFSAEPCITTYYSASMLQNIRAKLEGKLGRTVAVEGGSRESAELANRKDRMRTEARRLGIPVASGEIVNAAEFETCAGLLSDRVADVAQRLVSAHGGAIVRGVWSASGVDVRIVRAPLDRPALAQWLGMRPHVRAYLVEALLPLTASPNLQLWVNSEDRFSVIGVTGQRLNASGGHCGNYYPYRSPMLPAIQSAALEMSHALASAGFRGALGVDMMEFPDPETGELSFAFAETNGRMNASTYALALSEGINEQRRARGRAPIEAWISYTDTPVQPGSFAALRERLGDLVYLHNKRSGVVPYNTGLLSCGMVDLLTLADSVEEARDIEREALERLAAKD